jgi:hypothetical protein
VHQLLPQVLQALALSLIHFSLVQLAQPQQNSQHLVQQQDQQLFPAKPVSNFHSM